MSSDILLYITLKTMLSTSNGLNYLAVDILTEFQTVSVCIYASYIGYFDEDNNDTCYYRIDGMWLGRVSSYMMILLLATFHFLNTNLSRLLLIQSLFRLLCYLSCSFYLVVKIWSENLSLFIVVTDSTLIMSE